MRVGIAWYKRDEYDKIKTAMEDGDNLPETYDKFLTAFDYGIQVIRSSGHIPVKVYINPDLFPEWCRSRGLNVDKSGRMAYGNERARESRDDN